MLEQTKPEVIINLVGLTDVDRCEQYPDEAKRLNVKTVENLVNAIKKCSSSPFLIHVSTDQVYDGEGILSEKNVNLSNIYSSTKFDGELIAQEVNSTVLRTNFFGKSKTKNRKSLTDWLFCKLKLQEKIEVFEDVWFSPLSMNCLCRMIEIIIEKKIKGLFNLGSHKGMNKAEFAFHFAKFLNIPTHNMKLSKISNVKFLHAYRPKNMMMDLTKFEQTFNVKLPSLREEIEFVAKEFKT
jgi:dTDP-4-dehydrorhamnose reductase